MSPVLHRLGGRGPTLLICHATGIGGRTYQPLAELLSRHFEVVALDLRGHGEHPLGPDEAVALSDVAEDVVDAVAELPGRPYLFGHSVGAVVSLYAQATVGGLFESAFVYEPGLFPADAPMHGNAPVAEGARRRRERFGSVGEALERYATRLPLSELNAASLAAYVTTQFAEEPEGSIRLRCAPAIEAAFFDHAADITIEDVAAVDIPVTVASGPVGRSPLAEQNEHLARLLPTGRYRCFAHLGHLGPLEHAPSVALAVLETFGRGVAMPPPIAG